MPNYLFGEIPEISEGQIFKNRQALREVGIHFHPIAGIDGNPSVGCPSIVLNGGYIDDLDLGNEIIYTGHGGNDPNTGFQISDQSWDSTGNKALLVSEMKGLLVRVTRGFKNKSMFSPKVGYKYGGLYFVQDHFQDIGQDGFRICRYRLFKVDPIQNIENNELNEIPVRRIESNVLRIVRDNSISIAVKKMYDYCCQVCEIKISVRDIKYAEGAHIKPLGRPHNGMDAKSNIICLCPNHHVMLDKGVISIDNDLKLKGIVGRLKLDNNHPLNISNLEYHCSHIFIN